MNRDSDEQRSGGSDSGTEMGDGGDRVPVRGFLEVPAGDVEKAEALVRMLADVGHIAGRSFDGAAIGGRNLAGANLAGADLTQVDFTGAFLEGADFRGSDLRRAVFRSVEIRGANFDGARMWGLEIDEFTYKASGWTADEFAALHREHHFYILGLDAFPVEVRRLVDTESGLTLTFDSRLHRFDPTAFDAFIAQVLGPDTDVTIEERSNIDAEGPSFIRINGSRVEDLVAVAEAFYDRVWRETDNSLLPQGLAVLLARLEILREQVSDVRETVGILGNPDVQEMLEDQGAAHVLAKDKKLLQTRVQRVTKGLAAEARRRTIGKVGNVIQGEVEDGVASFLEDGGDDEG